MDGAIRLKTFLTMPTLILVIQRVCLKEMEGADSYGAGWNAAVNGYPLNSYFLYRTDGYFKDQAEVDRYYALYGEGKEDFDWCRSRKCKPVASR
mgnify:CR=1 FL=1